MRGKDKEALVEELLIAKYEEFYRLAYSRMQREDEALDLLMEAAYKAVFHAEKLKQPEKGEEWIREIILQETLS